MGTRNLTAVYDKNGNLKVAQYGQWDGYPSGQGFTILEALTGRRADIESNLKHVRWITEDELKEAIRDITGDPDKEWFDMDESKRFGEKYPELSRDIGGDILNIIADLKDGELKVTNQASFIYDTLFCEWAYIIDFQKNKLEVYSSWGDDDGNEPLKTRFYREKVGEDGEIVAEYGLKMVSDFDLGNLPDEEAFIETISRGLGEQGEDYSL